MQDRNGEHRSILYLVSCIVYPVSGIPHVRVFSKHELGIPPGIQYQIPGA